MDEREVERLVSKHLLMDLEEAETDLISGRKLKISVNGNSPGEMLTYISAAKWVVDKIRVDACDFKTAYEAYQDIIRRQ